jgi:4-hydroxybenzoate polyprenyltransferase
MGRKIIQSIFFGNYFVGALAIALSVETSCQLRLPFNSMLYYLILFSGAVMYYTYAYSTPLQSYNLGNARAVWYVKHSGFVKFSQWFLLFVCIVLGSWLLIENYSNLFKIPLQYWFVGIAMGLSATLYYGLLPRSFFKLNLRNTGWIKAFVIGFVWGCSVSLLPVIVLQLEHGYYYVDSLLLFWLFIKNWMFCTVNAIMFDIKDYADDSNHQLKTFVVQFGIHKTIFFILLPLALIGMFFMLAFTHYRHFPILPVIINLVPFILLLLVIYSMQKQKSILYYLVVIDGVIFIKAICGIVGMQFVH